MTKETDDEVEIQVEIDEDLEQEEPKEKVKKDPEDDEDEDSEEPDQEDSDESKSGETLEEKRERRRREKKMRRERQKRDELLMKNTIASLTKEVSELRNAATHITRDLTQSKQRTMESERKELKTLYDRAQQVMETAIAEGDGKKFVEAKKISDAAVSRYNLLESSKKEEQEEVVETKQEVQKNSLSEDGKRYGLAWVKKISSWYSPQGTDLDSTIVRAIDDDLFNEGYDPNSKEYWDELTDRCRQRLPNKFKSGEKKTSPQIVGGSGRESNPASYKSLTVPKEFLQSLKAAGYDPGTEKYKAAIKNYYAQRKGA